MLEGRHTDATRRVAVLLADKDRVGDDVLTLVVTELVPVAVTRLRAAIETSEDSTLLRALLQLLIQADWVSGLPGQVVYEVFELIRSRLAAPSEMSRVSSSATNWPPSVTCRSSSDRSWPGAWLSKRSGGELGMSCSR